MNDLLENYGFPYLKTYTLDENMIGMKNLHTLHTKKVMPTLA